jgi:hypothetical protein
MIGHFTDLPNGMKKSSSKFLSVVGFSLVLIMVGEHAFAQKVLNIGKNSDPRTTNNPVVLTQPSTPTPTTTPTPVAPPTGVPGTSTTGVTPTPTPTPAGVNGTTDVPPGTDNNGPLGGKTQVGGVDNQPKDNKKGGGKRVGNDHTTPTPTPTPTPGPQTPAGGDTPTPTPVAVPAVTDNKQTSQSDPVNPVNPKVPMVGNGNPVDQDPNKDKDKDQAASKTPCQDEALKKIYELILQDSSNVMGSLYELTSMRLARRALQQGATTLEELAKKDVAGLETDLAAKENADKIKAGMLSIYESYGKAADLTVVSNDLDASLKKGKDACYWCRGQRLWNDESSAYVLALAVGEKDSDLSDVDAATIWTIEKIRKASAATNPYYKFGHEGGNLLNISTRVARYLGRISGGQAAKDDEIKADIEAVQKSVTEAIARAYTQVKVTLHSCIDAQNKDCADCAMKAKTDFETENLGFDKIQRGLLQAVSKSENVKMEKALKAKMGDITFDLSGFAKGTVPADSRFGKVDACGHPLPNDHHKGSGRVPAAQKKQSKPVTQKQPEAERQQVNSYKYMPEPVARDALYMAPKYPVQFRAPAMTAQQKQLMDARKAWQDAHPGVELPEYDPSKQPVFKQGY